MTPAWTEGRIAALLSRETFQRRSVVLVDRCSWTGHECDLLAVTGGLRIIDVEIKISRADLKADARKTKWWHRYYDGTYEIVLRPGGMKYRRAVEKSEARLWPPRAWKHYYALPADIWRDDLLQALPSPNSGVILVGRDNHGVESIAVHRRARPNRDAARLSPQQVMDIARLASLRMWDAYGRLDIAERDVRYWRQAAEGARQEVAA